MKLFAPLYYKEFHCIADRCRHSCCIGWEICIDEHTLETYRALPGAWGDTLRKSIKTGTDGACFSLCRDGKCPHLDEAGLCRIIRELGEGYLCDICREHPRFYNTVGDRMECGVGAVCEEAARLLLSAEDYVSLYEVGTCEGEPLPLTGNFDPVFARAAIFAVLSDRSLAYINRMKAILADCGISIALGKRGYRTLFGDLEYLDKAHRPLFCAYDGSFDPSADTALLCERFFAYLLYRHASREETRHAFSLAVGYCAVLSGLFGYLVDKRGLAPVEAAVAVSEELEYSEENAEAIRFALDLHNL